jgi:hypothetical protein
MKGIKLLSVYALCMCIMLFQSCEDDAEKDISCNDDILGMWNVTNIQPSFCTLLSYEINTGSSNSILSIVLDDGTRKLSGNGLLDEDCSAMTYTVSEGSTIESGSITFDGNTLVDMSTIGCLFTATKQ